MNTPMDNWGYNDPAESEEPMTPDELRRSIFGESGVDSDTQADVPGRQYVRSRNVGNSHLYDVGSNPTKPSQCNSGLSPQDSIPHPDETGSLTSPYKFGEVPRGGHPAKRGKHSEVRRRA